MVLDRSAKFVSNSSLRYEQLREITLVSSDNYIREDEIPLQNFLPPITTNKVESLLSTDLSTRIGEKKKRKEEKIRNTSVGSIWAKNNFHSMPNLLARYDNRNRRTESPSSRYESMNKQKRERSEGGKENSKYIRGLVRGSIPAKKHGSRPRNLSQIQPSIMNNYTKLDPCPFLVDNYIRGDEKSFPFQLRTFFHR